MIITLPERMSLEKEVLLRALGAHVVRTPNGVPSSSPLSNINVAKRLQATIPHAVFLDQYKNTNNPDAHEFGTAMERIEAIENTPEKDGRISSGRVDAFIGGSGTGGTLTGVGRALKKHNPKVLVVGVDPVCYYSLSGAKAHSTNGAHPYREEVSWRALPA